MYHFSYNTDPIYNNKYNNSENKKVGSGHKQSPCDVKNKGLLITVLIIV